MQSPEVVRILALLAAKRSKAGLSQRALARLLNINENIFWELEAGRRNLQVSEFLDTARLLGEDPVELLREALKPE